MKFKIISLLLLTALLVSCTAEIAVPDVGDGVLNVPHDEIEPEIIDEPDVGDDDPVVPLITPFDDDGRTESSAPTDEPEEAPEPEETPEPRAEIRIPEIDYYRLSLITDEETELTAQLAASLSNPFPFLPNDDGIVEVFALALLESTIPREELLEINQKYNINWEFAFSIERLDIAFNERFSKNAVNIIPSYREQVNEDGLIGYGTTGFTNPYKLILKEQMIHDETIELYFYYFWDSGPRLEYLRRSETFNEESGEYELTDRESIGYWELCKEEQIPYSVIYEDALPTLSVVKYTFIPEDGRYKILNIENVT